MGALELYGEAKEVVDMSKFKHANEERQKRKEDRERRKKQGMNNVMRKCNKKSG